MIPLAYYHEINIQGVKMIRERRPCDAYLYLEDTIYNDTLLRLDFRYGDRTFSPHGSDGIKKIIFREQENGQTVIHYFQRNSTAEKQAIRLLQKAGLQCVSDSHFKLSPIAPEKTLPSGSAVTGKCYWKSLSYQVIRTRSHTIFRISG